MKWKIGILIKEDVLRLARLQALEEGRPLNNLIQDAITAYLGMGGPSLRERKKAYRLFCGHPIQITRQQLKEIMAEDASSLEK